MPFLYRELTQKLRYVCELHIYALRQGGRSSVRITPIFWHGYSLDATVY
jgi:hypothetical protein